MIQIIITQSSEKQVKKLKATRTTVCMEKNQGVTIITVEKWKRDYDKSLNMSLWLEYEKIDREFVSTLKCKVCKQFTDKIQSARNFNPPFITGMKTAMKDHSKTDMHQMAMRLYNKYCAEDVTKYAPIAKVLCTPDKKSKEILQKKIELPYFICKRRSVADVRKASVTKNKKNRDESIDGSTPSSSVNLED